MAVKQVKGRGRGVAVSGGSTRDPEPVTEVLPVSLVEMPSLDRVWVQVMVSHDCLYAGQVHEMPLSGRVRALIEVGYLEVIAPPDSSWW